MLLLRALFFLTSTLSCFLNVLARSQHVGVMLAGNLTVPYNKGVIPTSLC